MAGSWDGELGGALDGYITHLPRVDLCLPAKPRVYISARHSQAAIQGQSLDLG